MISEELPTIGDVDRILHFRYIKRQVKLITVGPTWINTGRWVPATPGVKQRAHRLKGLGNAIVPQISELLGRAILEREAASTV